MTDLTKSQLNTILSALDGKQRNPNTKDAALKAIAIHGERLGLSLEAILEASAGLLDGRISAEEWVLDLGSENDYGASEAADVAPTREGDAGGDHDVPASKAGEAETKTRTIRPNTKQALMIELLRRPEGATIAQIAAATGWQQHTCRGAIAGALKKKLGLTVTSEKPEGGEQLYRIADPS